jgi:predicted dehydrogenase
MNDSPSPDPSRRHFVKTTATAAAAASFPAIAGSAGTTETIRIGLIGCGGRGTGAVADAFEADDRTELAAIGDLFEDNIEKSLAQLRKRTPERVKVDASQRFTGFDAFERVANTDIDVVILATPPAFRPAHLRAAIEAGRHAFVEITAAIDAPGVRSVLESSRLADEKGLSIVSGFCWRYDLGLQAAQEKIREGAIGEIRALYATYYRSNLGYKFAEEKPAGMSGLEFQIRDWYRHLWLSGDVTILLSGGHSVDKMSWWLDDEMPVAAVATGSRVFPNWGNTFDNGFVAYEYANGIYGFLGCRSQSGCFNENGDTVIGTKGIFRFAGRIPVIEGENPWQYRPPRGEAPRSKYVVEHEALLGAIRSGQPVNDATRMARTTLMAIQGRLAAYTGQRVTWEQALNSEQKLVPETLDWDTPVEDVPLAVPGKTPFA